MNKLFIIFILIGTIFSIVNCDDAGIEEPCKGSDDFKKCVRNYFKTNGHCDVIETPSGKPIVLEGRHNAYVSKANITFGLTDVDVTNLEKSAFETFHINKKSGKLVMSVNFEGIGLESQQTHFVIYRRSQEPEFIIEHAKGIYPVILTAAFPTSTDISSEDVSNAMISAYVADPGLVQLGKNWIIGPKISESNDPAVIAACQQIMANIPTVLQELFLTGAPDLFITYLQKHICDFGVKIPY